MTANRRRLLLVTLVLSGAGLLFDVLLRGGGAPRTAAAGDAPVAAVASLEIEPADFAPVLASLRELPGQTPAWAELAVARDPFELPEELRPRVAAPPAPTPVASASPTSAPAEPEADAPDFETIHVLHGILHGPRPIAIVDGRACRVGTVIDGYRLIAIEREHVVFQRAGERVILRLPPPEPQ